MRPLFIFILTARLANADTSLNGFADNALDREVAAVERYDLSRISDQEELGRFIAAGLLVRVPNIGHGFLLDSRIGGHASKNRRFYRFVRPYTLRFIRRLGAQFASRFGRRFLITSLVRTCAYQKRVARGNQNAVSCDKTSHVTGATIDIRWNDLRRNERQWIERVLIELESRGLMQATKEQRQPVYHVMVYPAYLNYNPR